MKKEEVAYDVGQKPPIAKWIMLAIQHVVAMFGATILVPILVNMQAGSEVLTIPIALLSSGIGTLLYILCTKGKSPVYLGSSFAFITPLAAAYNGGGIAGAMTGIMCVGLVYMIMSLIITFTGKDWISKILPSVVIGPMIMIIGLGLAPNAISQMGLAGGDFDWQVVAVALITFIVTVTVLIFAKGFLKIIPFLVGIVAGYISAVAFGMVDFASVSEASFISMPKFVLPFRDYNLNFSVLLTIVPIALVTMCEHIGDHVSLSNIIGKDLIKEPGLNRTMLGDGVATFVGGLLGGPANTTYGENTAVVGISKVASVYVIGLAAVMAIAIAFFGKFTALISTIPAPVLGGVSLILYGFIAVNGLKVLIKDKVDFENPRNIIIASTMFILALGGAIITIGSVTISGMSLAAIAGVILNLVLKKTNSESDKVKLDIVK